MVFSPYISNRFAPKAALFRAAHVGANIVRPRGFALRFTLRAAM